MTRALSTLVGAAIAGGLLWVAGQVGDGTTGGYWGRIGIVAAAGLALTLARLPDVGVRTIVPSVSTFAVAFLPALVAAGWIVAAAQPHGNGTRGHVLAWSSDIGVSRVVHDMTPFALVLAFGLGTLLGLVFERRAVAVPAPEPALAPATAGKLPADRAADDTVVAERRAPVDPAADDTVVERDGELVRR